MARNPVLGGDIAEPLSVGSLFSGAGLIDLGLERAGWRTAWQSEIEPYASSVLRKHWPSTPNHGDIRGVERDIAVEPVELLAGGFPCQDLSSAGKRAGLEGARSGLWSEYARIIDLLRPRFVLIENVARLRSAGLDTVAGDLAARGYDAEWDVVGAASVGAPHLRERIWIVAWDASRVRLPDASGDSLRLIRERNGEQRGESRAALAGGDGSVGSLAGLADSECSRREGASPDGSREISRTATTGHGSGASDARKRGLVDLADADERGCAIEREAHDDDGRDAPRDLADGRGANVADAEGQRSATRLRVARSEEGSRGGRPDAPGGCEAVCSWRGRVFDPDALAEWAGRCAREVWLRAQVGQAGPQPGLGRASDGHPGGVDFRPVQAWERATPRSLTGEEAAERRILGERRTNRLTVIGNGVVPQIVEFIGWRLRVLRSFSV